MGKSGNKIALCNILRTTVKPPDSGSTAALADETEHFNHWTPGVPPPPDAAERGLYIDPVHF
jgi:hypothetical protein